MIKNTIAVLAIVLTSFVSTTANTPVNNEWTQVEKYINENGSLSFVDMIDDDLYLIVKTSSSRYPQKVQDNAISIKTSTCTYEFKKIENTWHVKLVKP